MPTGSGFAKASAVIEGSSAVKPQFIARHLILEIAILRDISKISNL